LINVVDSSLSKGGEEEIMALKTVSGTAECPECFAEIELKNVMQNEITQCPECGADLEVVEIEPLTLTQAPEEEEDWGE
jgi:alpha-aminoadipate carrier protein LysW